MLQIMHRQANAIVFFNIMIAFRTISLMKHLAPLLILAFGTLAHGNELTMLDDLAGLQWKNRIVIISETENEKDILTLLGKHAVEIDDRDIIWFIFKQADRTIA